MAVFYDMKPETSAVFMTKPGAFHHNIVMESDNLLQLSIILQATPTHMHHGLPPILSRSPPLPSLYILMKRGYCISKKY